LDIIKDHLNEEREGGTETENEIERKIVEEKELKQEEEEIKYEKSHPQDPQDEIDEVKDFSKKKEEMKVQLEEKDERIDDDQIEQDEEVVVLVLDQQRRCKMKKSRFHSVENLREKPATRKIERRLDKNIIDCKPAYKKEENRGSENGKQKMVEEEELTPSSYQPFYEGDSKPSFQRPPSRHKYHSRLFEAPLNDKKEPRPSTSSAYNRMGERKKHQSSKSRRKLEKKEDEHRPSTSSNTPRFNPITNSWI